MDLLFVLVISALCLICIGGTGAALYYYCCIMSQRRGKTGDKETGQPSPKKRRHANSNLHYADTPTGIPNVGANCFMNAMLQCLSWSPCLRYQLQCQIHYPQQKPYKGMLAKTLLDVLQQNHEDDEPEFRYTYSKQRRNVQKFCEVLSKDNARFSGSSQEDSFEFYNILVSGLEEEALENVSFQSSETTHTENEHIMATCPVTRLFGGMFVTCYHYQECGHVDPVFQRFTSLSIPVASGKKHQVPDLHVVSIEENKEANDCDFNTTMCEDEKKCLIEGDHGQTRRYGSVKNKPKRSFPDKEGQDSSVTKKSRLDASSPGKEGHDSSVTDDEERLESILPGKEEHNSSVTDDEERLESILPGKEGQDSSGTHGRRLNSDSCMPSRDGQMVESDVERGLIKLTEKEDMMASELQCRICKKQGETGDQGIVHKQLQLVSLPCVMVLHINRFRQHGRQLLKYDDRVSYPKLLDISNYCSVAMEVMQDASSSECPRQVYSLFGVVNHLGSMSGGHYYAYIKTSHRNVHQLQQQLATQSWNDPEAMATDIQSHLETKMKEGLSTNSVEQEAGREQDGTEGNEDTWYYVSDSAVHEERETTVMNSSAAYILMYERTQ